MNKNNNSDSFEILKNMLINLENSTNKEQLLLCSLLFRKYLEEIKFGHFFNENQTVAIHKILHFSKKEYEKYKYYLSALRYFLEDILKKMKQEYKKENAILTSGYVNNIENLLDLVIIIESKNIKSVLIKYNVGEQKYCESIVIDKIQKNDNDLGKWIIIDKKEHYYYTDLKFEIYSKYSFYYNVLYQDNSQSRFYKVSDDSIKYLDYDSTISKLKSSIYSSFVDNFERMWVDKKKSLYSNLFSDKNIKETYEVMTFCKDVNNCIINDCICKKDKVKHEYNNGALRFIKIFPTWLKSINQEGADFSSIENYNKLYPVHLSIITSKNYVKQSVYKVTLYEKYKWGKLFGEPEDLYKICNLKFSNKILFSTKEYERLSLTLNYYSSCLIQYRQEIVKIDDYKSINKKNYDFFSLFLNSIFEQKSDDVDNDFENIYVNVDDVDDVFKFDENMNITDNEKYLIFWDKNSINFLVDFAGTGKTRIIKSLFNYFVKLEKNLKIILMAPTKKAISIYGDVDKKIKRSTIQLHQQNWENENGCICKYDLVVVDEISMVDREIWHTILKHSNFCSIKLEFPKFLFVGDEYQLKPVRQYAYLRELILFLKKDKKETNMIKNISKNSETFRQLIFENKTRYLSENNSKHSNIYNDLYKIINDIKNCKTNKDAFINSLNSFSRYIEKNNTEFYYDGADAIEKVKSIINEKENAIVITPYNFGILGVKSFEQILNKSLSQLRKDDTVICNSKDDYVCTNQAIYKIISIKENEVPSRKLGNSKLIQNYVFNICLFFDAENHIDCCKRVISNEENDDVISSSEILTIHRSQGESFDDVIFVIPKTNKLSFFDFYTAITRAKKSIKIIMPLGFSIYNLGFEDSVSKEVIDFLKNEYSKMKKIKSDNEKQSISQT